MVKMTKRALMAVKGLPLMRPNPGRMELAPNVYIASDWPMPVLNLPSEYTTRLGANAMEPLATPRFVAWADQEVGDAEIGAVDKELERKLGLVDLALSLCTGWGNARRVITVEIHLPNGQRQFQGITQFEPWSARESFRAARFDFQKLPAITARLIELTAPGWEKYEFFIRGIRTFYRACEQDMVDDRYELFCRAIETVLQTEQGSGAKQFAEAILDQQGRLDPTTKAHRIRRYEAHYHRRNDVVHGHRFLEEKKDRRAIALMERVARQFFQELLTNEKFFEATFQSQQARAAVKREKREKKKLKQGAPPAPQVTRRHH
jgi:hypothetical protein